TTNGVDKVKGPKPAGEKLEDCMLVDLGSFMSNIENVEKNETTVNWPIIAFEDDMENLMYGPALFGNPVTIDEGKLLRADAFRLLYVLNEDDPIINEVLPIWSDAIVFKLQSLASKRLKYTDISFITHTYWNQEEFQTLISILKYGTLAGIALVIFTTCATITGDWVTSKFWLGLIAVFTVIMGILSTYAVLALAGVAFTVYTPVVGILTLGIGVDDAFVLLNAWMVTSRKLSVPERLAEVYAEAGISIATTTITNVLSFSIAAMLPIKYFTVFGLNSAVGVGFAYIYTLTFFGAFLALMGKFEEQQRNSITLMRMSRGRDIMDPQSDEKPVTDDEIPTYPIPFLYALNSMEWCKSWAQILNHRFAKFYLAGRDNPLASDVRFNEEGNIIASRFMLQPKALKSVTGYYPLMKYVRGLIRTPPYSAYNITIYNPNNVFLAELYSVMRDQVVPAVLMTCLVMCVVGFIMIPKKDYALYVGLSIASTELGIVGFLRMLGYNIDLMIFNTLVVAFGFSIDCVAHISFAFSKARCDISSPTKCDSCAAAGLSAKCAMQPVDRLTLALKRVMRALFTGSLSTIIAVAPLYFVPSNVIYPFSIGLVITITLSLLHGFVFLPTLLLFVSSRGMPKLLVLPEMFGNYGSRANYAPQQFKPGMSLAPIAESTEISGERKTSVSILAENFPMGKFNKRLSIASCSIIAVLPATLIPASLAYAFVVGIPTTMALSFLHGLCFLPTLWAALPETSLRAMKSLVVDVQGQLTYGIPYGTRSREDMEVMDHFSTYHYDCIPEFLNQNQSLDPGRIMPDRVASLHNILGIILTPKQGKTILKSSIIEEAILVQEEVLRTEVKKHWKKWTFEDLCMQAYSPCIEKDSGADAMQRCMFTNVTSLKETIADFENGETELTWPILLVGKELNEVIFGPAIFGRPYLKNGSLEDATSLRLVFIMNDMDPTVGEVLWEWSEKLAESLIRLQKEKLKDTKISFITKDYWSQEEFELLLLLIRIEMVAAVVLIIFTTFSSMTDDWVTSKFWLGILVVVTVAMSNLTTYALLAIFDIPFANCTPIQGILALGIGVDDGFVLMSAWAVTPKHLSVPERLSLAYGEAGASIALTSITNMIGFAVVSCMPVGFINIYGLNAAVSVAFAYIFTMTFFGGCLALMGRAEEQKRHCITFRKMPDRAQDDDETKYPIPGLSLVLGFDYCKHWAFLLSHKTAKMIMNKPIDYSDPEIQKDLLGIVEFLENDGKFRSATYTDCWLRSFLAYVENNAHLDLNITGEKNFNYNLKKYFLAGRENLLAGDVRFDENGRIMTSRFMLQPEPLDTVMDFQGLMDYAYKIVGKKAYAKYKITMYNPNNPFYAELFRMITTHVVPAMLITCAIMATMGFIFIPDKIYAFFVTMSMISTSLGVIAVLYLWDFGIDLKAFCILNLAFAFSVDSVSHLSFAFSESHGDTPTLRLEMTFRRVMRALFTSSFSTIISVVPAILIPASLAYSFVVGIPMTMVLSFLHGLLFLPTLLAALPGTSLSDCRGKKKRKMTEKDTEVVEEVDVFIRPVVGGTLKLSDL
ncbi:unnamed protein product, partial [Notodromas monacha]